MLKRMIVALSVIIAVVLCVILYADIRKERVKSAHLEELKSQASVYEQERDDILKELDREQRAINGESEAGTAIIGYHVATEEALTAAKKQSAEYGFSPVIVVNCNAEQKLLDEVISSGLEFVLMEVPFDRDAIENMFEETQCQTFLLGDKDENEENLTALHDIGFTQLFRHENITFDAMSEDGIASIGYSYVANKSISITSRIYNLVNEKDSLMIVFDLESDLTEEIIASTLDYIQQNVKIGTVLYGTVADSMSAIQITDEERAQKQREYEAYAEQQQARLNELNEMIHEIYSKWDEVE